MTIFDNYEVWFVIGSQHLYGPETLRQVTQHAEHVVNALNTEAKLPCKLVLKPLGTTPDEITAICRDANYDDRWLLKHAIEHYCHVPVIGYVPVI